MSIQVYDGSGYLQIPGTPGPQSFAHVGPTAPSNPEVGQMWVPDDQHLLDQWDDDWQYPTLLNNWRTYGTGADYGTARYRKCPGGLVTIEGMVTGGSAGFSSAQAMFTLPVGYRVTERHVITSLSYTTTYVGDTRINIDPGNFVSLGNGGNTWVTLHCVYYADA